MHMEHIVVSAVMAHFDSNNLLNDNQHGFRKRRFCDTQLLEFTEELIHCLEMWETDGPLIHGLC